MSCLMWMLVNCLYQLPPGLAPKLPGLAVRCHLAMVKPVKEETWGKLAIQVLTGCLKGNDLHTVNVQHSQQEAPLLI